MLFNSFSFIIFLFVLFVVYYTSSSHLLKKIFLLSASIVFVYFAGWVSLVVITAATFFSFFFGLIIEKNNDSKYSRLIFIFFLLILILNLFYFKYFNFFVENLSQILKFSGVESTIIPAEIILPLGISFFTFQILGYLIDIRLGRIQAEKNLFDYANYLFFFPKLLAGPIERSHSFLPQNLTEKKLDYDNISQGIKLIIYGFFQKLVVGDQIAIYVNTVYGSIDTQSGVTLIFVAILYTFQVYADFAGYTNIARGISKMLGYNLMENFERPLLASSITDFWRRWHISLSSWVNDYIYTPLAINYRNIGKKGIILSTFIAFIIIGIWHGAKWTFVFFGIIQGIIISIELLSSKWRKNYYKRIPAFILKPFSIIFTFLLISFSLILFRADNMEQAISFITGFNNKGSFFTGSIPILIYSIFGIFIIMIKDIRIEFFKKNIFELKTNLIILKHLPYALLLILIMLFGVFDGSQFIYFKF
jgi:alginate O-acetyltransferase complex protein AlgI